jgi:predicted dehydrogenase
MGVRWGILSTAAINDLVLAGARASDRVEVVAVASRDGARAQEYARAHDIARAHAGYEALLADPEVEAVYISLPNSLHAEWTVRALDAGKHVLVEKPFGRRADEVAAACALAERRRLVLAEAFMWRHHPQAHRVLELVQQGAIGRLRVIRGAFSFALEQERGVGDTRFQPELDGGALMDVGCYPLSAIRLVSGEEPVRAHAEQVLGSSGVDVVLAATLRMPSGVLGLLDCGFTTPHRDELEIIGEGGSLFLDDPWHCREPVIELRRGGQVERIEIERVDPYRCELEDVSDAIRGGSSLRAGPADALAQAHVIEALYSSADTGLAVDVGAATGR